MDFPAIPWLLCSRRFADGIRVPGQRRLAERCIRRRFGDHSETCTRTPRRSDLLFVGGHAGLGFFCRLPAFSAPFGPHRPRRNFARQPRAWRSAMDERGAWSLAFSGFRSLYRALRF